MLKKLLPLVVWVFWPSYCYSESIAPYPGQTGNAASNGHQWVMKNILPDVAGLDINAVIYNYTIQKKTEDTTTVHIQNENASGSGYIFRETDEWRPGSLGGTIINKVVQVHPGIPRAAWGDGSIAVEGNGSVTDANVSYNYRVDPCFDPQFDPNCPGYVEPKLDIEIPTVDLTTLYDATKDENVDLSNEELVLIQENDDQLEKEKEKEKEEAEEKLRKYRLEKALSATDASALFAENQLIRQMNEIANLAVIAQGYNKTISGGTYEETIQLVDSKLPDNGTGLRNNLAQQRLHNELVDMQYK